MFLFYCLIIFCLCSSILFFFFDWSCRPYIQNHASVFTLHLLCQKPLLHQKLSIFVMGASVDFSPKPHPHFDISPDSSLLKHIWHCLFCGCSSGVSNLTWGPGLVAGGRGLLSSKSYVDVPVRLFYTNFLPNFPPISIPFSKEKHPILTKLCVFFWSKIHPIYVLWAPSSLVKKPPIAIPNFPKKRPKRQAHRPIRIPSQCENLPGLGLVNLAQI